MRFPKVTATVALCAASLSLAVGSASTSFASPTAKGSSSVFTVATTAIPTTLDPGVVQGNSEYVTQAGYTDTLGINAKGAKGQLASAGDIQPELAKSFTALPGGSYKITLKSMKSQYGHELTSADVLYSFQRALAVTTIVAVIFNAVGISTTNPITVINSKTFTLNATTPYADVLGALTVYELGIVDHVEANANATAADPWAKTWMNVNSDSYGPYEVTSFVPGASLTMTKNPHYFAASSVYYKSVEIRAVADAATEASLVSSGQVDWANTVPYSLMPSIAASGKARVAATANLNSEYLLVNTSTAPFNNALVREAVSQSINRAAFRIKALASRGVLPTSIASSGVYGTPSAKAAIPTTLKYDPTAAKALLTQAGYPNGFSATLSVDGGDLFAAQEAAIATLMQSELAPIGINLTINTIASDSTYHASLFPLKFQMAMADFGPLISDMGYFAKLEWANASPFLAPSFSSPGLISLVTTANANTDPKSRKIQLLQATHELDQELPSIPLIGTPNQWAFSKTVTGEYANAETGIYFQYMKPAA